MGAARYIVGVYLKSFHSIINGRSDNTINSRIAVTTKTDDVQLIIVSCQQLLFTLLASLPSE